MPQKTLTFVFMISLAAVAVTGFALVIEPPAQVAAWASWSLLGLSKPQWDAAHLIMGLLCAASGAAAFVVNRAALGSFFKGAAGKVLEANKALAAAFVLTALVFLGTIAGLPPMAQIAGVTGFIKEQQTKTYGEPPFAHAEEFPLAELARRLGIPPDKALAALTAKNIRIESPDMTLKEIGVANGLAPGGVFAAVEFAREMSGAPSERLPKDPPPGLGKRKISDICEEYELDIKAMIKKLAESGIAAAPAMTLKEVADANSLLPIDVYDAMRSDRPVSRPAQVQIPAQPNAQPNALSGSQPAVSPTQDNGQLPPTGFENQPQDGQALEQTQELPPDTAALSALPPPPGLEKMMLGDFCKEFNLPVQVAVNRLAAKGITAFVDMTFKELALENDKTPEDVMRIITTQ